MPQFSPSQNKAIVLEAFDTLFNRRDVERAKPFWSPDYIQHSAHVPAGREGLFGTIVAAPNMRYEHQLALAERDYVMIHGRFSHIGQAASWIVVDICRLENGVLVEHWDVIQNEVEQAASAGGAPMFGDVFPDATSASAKAAEATSGERPAPMGLGEGEKAKAIVRAFYEGAARGKIADFADQLADEFELYVPAFLPWGGRFDKAGYVARLPEIARALDFTRLTYLSFVEEAGHVIALISIGVQGTDETTIISEHWDIANNKVLRLRVAYFDPKSLLEQFAAKRKA